MSLLDVNGEDTRWNDVGAKWDALVGAGAEVDGDVNVDAGESEGTLVNGSSRSSACAGAGTSAAVHEGRPSMDDDGIRWAEEAHGPAFERYKLRAGRTKRTSRIVEEVGPSGELPDYTLAVANGNEAPVGSHPSLENGNGNTNADEAEGVAEDLGAKEADKTASLHTTIPKTSTLSSTSIPIPIPIPIPSTPSSGNAPGSGTSSSDGSLADKSVVDRIASLELERGRNTALTPVQGNGRLRDTDL